MRPLFILALATLTLVSSQIALAADMPRKAPPPVAPPSPSWTGFYLGGHVGAGWRSNSQVSWVDPNFALGVPSSVPSPLGIPADTGARFVGGIHAGYNWQFAPTWLLGVEGDISWTNLDQTGFLSPVFATGPSTFLATDAQTRWLASARARLGFIGWNTLWYVTGGVAWTHASYSGFGKFNNNFTDSVNFGESKIGWVAGGGAEYMLTPNWLLRGEYLYYRFDGTSGVAPYVPAFGGPQPVFSWGDYHIQVVRLGATYKFDWRF